MGCISHYHSIKVIWNFLYYINQKSTLNLIKWFSICKLLFNPPSHNSLSHVTGHLSAPQEITRQSKNTVLPNEIILEKYMVKEKVKVICWKGLCNEIIVDLLCERLLYCVLHSVIITHLLSGKQHVKFSSNLKLTFLQNCKQKEWEKSQLNK